ncbi:MAG: LEA type 2 family protein [Thermodesulfobacteriota bacterium]
MPTFCLKAARLFGWGLAGLIVLGGCGFKELTREELKPPRVSLQALVVRPPTSEGWPLGLTLKLANPNPQTLELRGYDYELRLEGLKAVQGESQETLTLPGQGQAVVTVPAVLKFQALGKLLPQVLKQEKLRYDLAGGFRPAPWGGLVRVPFHFQGQVTLPEGLRLLRSYFR